MTGRGGQLSRYLFKMAVTTTILAVLFSEFNLDDTIALMLSVSPSYFIAGLATMLIAHLLNAYQVRFLMIPHGMSLSTVDIFKVNMITKFYGLMLPGFIAGGAIRWYYFSQPGRKRAQAAAVILFNRMFEIIILTAVGVCFWIVDQWSLISLLEVEMLLLALTGVGLIYFLAVDRRCHGFLKDLVGSRVLPRGLAQKADKVLDAFYLYSTCGGEFHGKLFVMALVRQLVITFSVFLFALGLGIDIDLAALAWIRSVINLILIVPLSIAGLGIREAGFVYFFNDYAISAEQALALSLLIFVRVLLFSILGIIFLFSFRYRKVLPETDME